MKNTLRKLIRWVELTFNLYEYPSNDKLLTAEHLMKIHEGMKKAEASDLLKFCNDNTVRFISCYGLGEIMFPMWVKHKFNNK